MLKTALRRLVERQVRPIPDRGRRVQLDRVVRLGRRDIGLVELDRRAGESGLGDRRARFAGDAPGRTWCQRLRDRRRL